ncbi:hypothetical protein ACH79_27375 [Bradyrhizobium sp. CCBAU 051011]|nr:hypothetical protein ACH79_27375 [Bradyrhizobium sp. CCBAU 051011]
MFERVVERCIAADLVGGEGFAVDASLLRPMPISSARSLVRTGAGISIRQGQTIQPGWRHGGGRLIARNKQ